MKYETDEEVVRRIMADQTATPSEKEMAFRIQRLIESHDAMEDIMLGYRGAESRLQ